MSIIIQPIIQHANLLITLQVSGADLHKEQKIFLNAMYRILNKEFSLMEQMLDDDESYREDTENTSTNSDPPLDGDLDL